GGQSPHYLHACAHIPSPPVCDIQHRKRSDATSTRHNTGETRWDKSKRRQTKFLLNDPHPALALNCHGSRISSTVNIPIVHQADPLLLWIRPEASPLPIFH